MSRVAITPVGRSIATSGLRPATGNYILDYSAGQIDGLARLFDARGVPGQNIEDREDLEFAFLFAALTSPEYDSRESGGRRFTPYQIQGLTGLARPNKIVDLLAVNPWQREAPAATAADLACDWIAGSPLRELEERFADLRGGALRGLFRDLAQILFGWSDVLNVSTAPTLMIDHRPTAIRGAGQKLGNLRAISSALRSAAKRLDVGLPEEALWMTRLRLPDGKRAIFRNHAIALYNAGLYTPQVLTDRGKTSAVLDALKPVVDDLAAELARSIRESVQVSRAESTSRIRASQIRRAPSDWEQAINRYYDTFGTDFEDALSAILERVKIVPIDRDTPGKSAFPDFVIEIAQVGRLIIECKSSPGDGLIDLNAATDVIRKAGVHGFEEDHKVTICKQYLSPDVPRKLASCRGLSVVNAEDFIEALIRIAVDKGSPADLGDWCAQEGHITVESFVPTVRVEDER